MLKKLLEYFTDSNGRLRNITRNELNNFLSNFRPQNGFVLFNFLKPYVDPQRSTYNQSIADNLIKWEPLIQPKAHVYDMAVFEFLHTKATLGDIAPFFINEYLISINLRKMVRNLKAMNFTGIKTPIIME